MCGLLVALVIAAPAPKPAEPPVALATGLLSGREVRYADSLGTAIQGMAITLLGSSSVCIEASEEKWDAAIKKEHIRVQFAKPHAMRAIGVDEQKTYEVAEILIGLSDERDFKGLMIKAGGKYHQFAKFDGALWIAFQQRLLGR